MTREREEMADAMEMRIVRLAVETGCAPETEALGHVERLARLGHRLETTTATIDGDASLQDEVAELVFAGPDFAVGDREPASKPSRMEISFDEAGYRIDAVSPPLSAEDIESAGEAEVDALIRRTRDARADLIRRGFDEFLAERQSATWIIESCAFKRPAPSPAGWSLRRPNGGMFAFVNLFDSDFDAVPTEHLTSFAKTLADRIVTAYSCGSTTQRMKMLAKAEKAASHVPAVTQPQVGDVVQIDFAHDETFGGSMMTVTKVREWGLQGYVRIPGQGDAHYRVPNGGWLRVGAAPFQRIAEEGGAS